MSFRNGAAGCDRRYVALVALVRVVRYEFAGEAAGRGRANEGAGETRSDGRADGVAEN